MTFAAPLFLLAVFAAAIPVVLHLVNRRRAKEAPFPTLRFLKLSVQKTRRRKRIQDLLLMVLRAAVLLLAAVGLARPAMTNLGALWGSAQTAVVIILDNSASMGMIDRDRVRLETAAAAAAQVLDQLTDGDQAALLPTCGPPPPGAGRLDRTQQSVRQILRQCRVSYERANLMLKLRQARQMLAGSDAPNKQIFILTDMQRVSWEEEGIRDWGLGIRSGIQESVGEEREGEKGNPKSQIPNQEISNPQSLIPNPSSPPIPVIIVDCDRAGKPDAAVERVDLETAVPMVGLPAKAVVTVLNASSVAQQRLVELTIDGVKQASSPQLNVPPGGRVKHGFTFSLQRAGLHRGEVSLIGEDGSRYDDRRFFAIDLGRGVPVAVVEARRHEIPYLDDAYYLEQALALGMAGAGGFNVSTLLIGDLTGEPLEKYKVLYCVNLPALDAEAAERLGAYVAGGGNLVWICGDNVETEAYNRMNQLSGGRLLPAPLADVRAIGRQEGRDSWRVGFLDEKHPALKNLLEPASLYESILVYRHVRMEVEKGHARVLARLDDGEPLLIERGVGDGRTLMLGAGAVVSWSNLSLRPIFMPLVVRLTFHLSETDRVRTNLLAGQPLEYRFIGVAEPLEVELVPPDGETLRLKTSGEFRYANTYDIGIYVLRIPGAASPTQVAYSVNFDPAEAEPARIEAAKIEELLGGAPLIVAEDPDDLSETFVRLREGKSLWGPFLAAVLIALVFETFLSNRFGSKA
ncbi:MAG: BatA domain-containing protein [Planctomycetes bacterium]|nr:BatA domain-containing protein [Planctomycetota bacterium]